MNSMKPTPGPWEHLPEKLHGGRHVAGRHPMVITDEGDALAHLTRFSLESGPCPIAEANARLIAAAPDMLAALLAINNALGSDAAAIEKGLYPSQVKRAFDVVENAIRKAQGVAV